MQDAGPGFHQVCRVLSGGSGGQPEVSSPSEVAHEVIEPHSMMNEFFPHVPAGNRHLPNLIEHT